MVLVMSVIHIPEIFSCTINTHQLEQSLHDERAEGKMRMHMLHNAGAARVSKSKLVRDLGTTSLIMRHERKI